MKFWYIFISIFFGFLVTCRIYSQDIFPLKSGEIVYSDTVKVDSLKADELFSRAYKWFSNNYPRKERHEYDFFSISAKKDNGIITGYGNFSGGIRDSKTGLAHLAWIGNIKFNLELRFYDKKYYYSLTKVTFSEVDRYNNISTYDLTSDTFPRIGLAKMWKKQKNLDWIDLKKAINFDLLIIINDLKRSLTNS